MPDWLLFGAVASVVAVAFVVLARASARAVTAALDARTDPGTPTPPSAAALESTALLVGNTLASHGLLLGILLGTVWYARVPVGALGLGLPTAGELGIGLALGVALAAANEGGARVATRVGLRHDDRLRRLLAPASAAGWLGLLLVTLPLIAAAEELLFRGVLVGGFAVGFGLPVWGLVVGSSVLFGLGHGLQGEAGVAVTTGLGLGLAAGFVLTGSLAVVVVAHYVVNALEFVVHEGPTGGWPAT